MLKYLVPIVLLVVACNNNKENDETVNNEPSSAVVLNLKDEKSLERRMFVIDSLCMLEGGTVASSLSFGGENGSRVKALAHMIKGNIIMKLEEQFSEGDGKTNGVIYYYMNNGKQFASHEYLDYFDGTENMWVDRISFYDESGKVIKTKEKRAYTQDDAEQLSYKVVANNSVNTERAFRLINNEKEFKTTFQGLFDAGGDTYLAVGPNSPDAMVSNIRVSFRDEFIETVMMNQKAFMGTPVKVQFKEVTTHDGFTFQEYTGGSF